MARTKCFNRDEALEKAMQAFWAKGYEATSVQDLVDCMGINRGSLYDTFGDKHQLFLEALDQYGTGALLRTDVLRQDGDAREILSRFMYVFMQKQVMDPKRRGCFMTNAAVELCSRDDECAERVRVFFEDMEDALKELISRGQRDGTFKTKRDAASLAAFFVGVMQGMRVVGKVNPNEKVLGPMVDVALTVLDGE
ncbi:TetR/AcrR family transcriptional regulator [Sneathiella sp. HT1-7]|jgi:TetR/AcrR family transcriptional repressor of nem operon|uniref:TetR/AcrR family transcriptional regulator n=1 Tax=Sneathiella sp. HT1-7 TaxID=2887192 RepID=UPI001D143F9D|nr:TetR/AcrR family transcriptional regulator [Sneathiella sp. HT1-7]MCC3304095.1 TetR/AcrR family transcriptional regulator [Sneathiella sp. HT1-7]